MTKEKKALKRKVDNEAYINRKIKNMLAMSRKTVFRIGDIAVEMPDVELVEGMGFEYERKIRK